MKGQIVSINVSETKGVSKTPVKGRVKLKAGWGIVEDVHAGTPDRDVTLLPREALGGVPYGGYGENIDTAGIAILDLPVGTVVKIGRGATGQRATGQRATFDFGSGDEGIRIQITRHGKVCPSRCSIYYSLGNCIMQEKGVFAVVLTEGEIGEGDEISVESIPTTPDDIAWILDNCKRIALFGASPKADRPSYRVMRYLLEKGYEVIPIRPGIKEILGQRCYPTVQEVPGLIDLALSFRRSEDALPLVEEAIARGAKAFWMQEGIVSPDAFVRALGAGLRVVMDRCMYKESLARET